MADVRGPNPELVTLRENAGLSQQDLADDLSELAQSRFGRSVEVTKKTVGRWERGEVAWPQPFYRRLLAERFRVAVDELGFYRPRPNESELDVSSPFTTADELWAVKTTALETEPRVVRDQDQWRELRRAMSPRRRDMAALAAELYPDALVPGLTGAGVITHPDWLPTEPVPLEQVVLDRLEDAPAAVIGTEPEGALSRPLMSGEQRFRRYSHAIRDLTPPALFENRLCFRLVSVDWTRPAVQLSFGAMGFFDALDVNELLAHETAQHSLARTRGGDYETVRPSWRGLKFRKLIGDPFDLNRRSLMAGIGTLTIRGGESPSVLLHQRDAAKVAGGGDMAHLLPAGIFQPSSVMPECVARDFSVWRNIQREFAEEILGHDEYDGTGQPVDYDADPFATMDQALTAGTLRAYCLGVTLDALTLACDILTVVVLDPDLYDSLVGRPVESNAEGTVSTRSIPFEQNTLNELNAAGILSPGAAAALHLAWAHRRTLLG